MIPKIFHRTVPQAVNERHEHFWETFKEWHPDYEFKTWRDPIDKKDFELAHLWASCGNGAQLADLIRLEVVYRFGGIYVDADMECVGRFPDMKDIAFFIGTEDGDRVTNALFGAAQEHPEIRRIMDYLKEFSELPSDIPANVVTGPELFSRHLRFSDDILVFPRTVFYPVSHGQNVDSVTALPTRTLTVHHWDGSWLDKKPSPVTKRRLRKRQRRYAAKERRRKFYQSIASLYKKVSGFLPVTQGYTDSAYLVTKSAYGCYLLADPKDISVTPQLYFGGVYEKQETKIVQSLVRKGDWAIDVGANIGYYSILFANLVGSFGRVHAYEPNPKIRALLSKSVMMNYFQDRVRLSGVALSDRTGTAVFNVSETIAGGSSLLDSAFEHASFGIDPENISYSTMQVDTQRLDELFDPAIPVRLLKIDVEGAEAQVFEGADALLKNRTVDVVMFETLNESLGLERKLMRAVVAKVTDQYGYRLYSLRRGFLSPCSVIDWEFGRYRTYFLISPDAQDIAGELLSR